MAADCSSSRCTALTWALSEPMWSFAYFQTVQIRPPGHAHGHWCPAVRLCWTLHTDNTKPLEKEKAGTARWSLCPATVCEVTWILKPSLHNLHPHFTNKGSGFCCLHQSLSYSISHWFIHRKPSNNAKTHYFSQKTEQHQNTDLQAIFLPQKISNYLETYTFLHLAVISVLKDKAMQDDTSQI